MTFSWAARAIARWEERWEGRKRESDASWKSLKSAIACYASKAGRKLWAEGQAATAMEVFVSTSGHEGDRVWCLSQEKGGSGGSRLGVGSNFVLAKQKHQKS